MDTNIPQITINGKTFTAKKPKARLWREIMHYDEVETTDPGLTMTARTDKEMEIVAKVYADPAVTVDAILDSYDVDEIRQLYADVVVWLLKLWSGKLAQIPNEESPTA